MKHHYLPLLCVGLLGLAPQCLAENLVNNPGFEEKLAGWDAYRPGPAENEALEFGSDSKDPHEGAYAARMESTAPVRWALVSKRSIPVEPGEKLRVEGWVRCDAGAELEPNLPGVYISWQFSDKDWINLGMEEPEGPANFIGLWDGVARWDMLKELQPAELPGKWTKISAVVEAPPNAAYLSSLGGAVWGVKGVVYWDDFSVERVDAATPLTEKH
jgi:hypothetical protein